jgi:hypothetical protein
MWGSIILREKLQQKIEMEVECLQGLINILFPRTTINLDRYLEG